MYVCTDNAPLQWLSAQNMEGTLCQWSLAMQEYNFKIVYRKGTSNGNADALSCLPTEMCAITLGLPRCPLTELRACQSNNDAISAVLQACLNSNDVPQAAKWNKSPFYRYNLIWLQLKVVDGVLCRQYSHSPIHQEVTEPILPPNLHKNALSYNHDAPVASHLGKEKTLECLRLHTGLI